MLKIIMVVGCTSPANHYKTVQVFYVFSPQMMAKMTLKTLPVGIQEFTIDAMRRGMFESI